MSTATRVFSGGLVLDGDHVVRADVALAGSRILEVGPATQVQPLTGPDTAVVELDGRLLSPGFIDVHVHPVTGGLTLLRCDLSDAEGPDHAQDVIAACSARHAGPWVMGGGWHFTWFEHGMPSATLLDSLVPDRPAYLRVADGHAGWANSAALALAGITADTPDPPDGRIERLPDGTPQGTLQEGAMDLIERILPPDTADDLDAALLAGQDHLFSFGVTAWQDAWVTPEIHDTYLRLSADGRLKATVRGALWWERAGGFEQLDLFEAQRAQSTDRYVAGSVKLMLDGICENFTARVLEPYLDDTGSPTTNVGLDFLDPDALPQIVTEIMRRGFQPHFHALGDAAVRTALDAVATARRELGWTDVRPHIAHLQMIHPEDVPRFAELGVIANVQALWACHDEAMTEMTLPFLTEDSAMRQYPFRSLLDGGASLAMGSDWSVTTPNVMQQVGVAATRQVPGDRTSVPFLPEQRLTVAEALRGFTVGSAHACFLESDRGVLRPGAAADLVVLDGDPFTGGDIDSIEVDMTLVAGNVVYERGSRRV